MRAYAEGFLWRFSFQQNFTHEEGIMYKNGTNRKRKCDASSCPPLVEFMFDTLVVENVATRCEFDGRSGFDAFGPANVAKIISVDGIVTTGKTHVGRL